MSVYHTIRSGAKVRARSFIICATLGLLIFPAAYVWDSNPHYRRMRALVGMVTDSKHRIEIISDGLPNYIHRGMHHLCVCLTFLIFFSEWKKARILLGDTSDDYPDSLLRLRRSNFLSFLDAIQDDLPLVSLYSTPCLSTIQSAYRYFTHFKCICPLKISLWHPLH